MAGSRASTMSRCSQSSAAKGSRATQATVGEDKGKKRSGSDLAAEEPKVVAVEEVEQLEGVESGIDGAKDGKATVGKRKWRMSQEHIDFIMSWKVSEFVFSAPDNIDDMNVSDELKLKFRANREKAAVLMREHRRANKEIQDWVKSELEKHGCVEVETTSEIYAKYRVELEEQGYIEIEDQ